MEIIRGKQHGAQKVVIYGPSGIGKTTLAAKFPNPLFIDTEGSTKEIDVARFKKPSSWTMLTEQINYVLANRSICKTLVIDSVDWAEMICTEFICSKHQKSGIESFAYGTGYMYVKEEFGRFLNALEGVIEAGINVVLTAHAILRKFEQPDEMGAYDRWELKLGKKTTNLIAPMVKEWADMVLFCNYKTYSVAVDKDGKKHKAQGGQRVMYTSHHPCWDAKNRVGLPEEVAMDYEVIKPFIEFETLNDTSSATTKPKTDLDTVVEEPTKVNDIDSNIPQALRDLMIANGVTESDIQKIVAKKGYFPADMPVSSYPKEFIDGCLIAAWGQVYEMIKGDKLF